MTALTKTDRKTLWDSVDCLLPLHRYKEIKTIVKMITGNTLIDIPKASSIAQKLGKVTPSPRPVEVEIIKSLRSVDSRLQELTERREINEIDLILDNYITLTTKVLDVSKDGLRCKKRTQLNRKSLGKVSFTELTGVRTFSPVLSQSDSYSPSEAGEILNLSDQTIRRMCANGNSRVHHNSGWALANP